MAKFEIKGTGIKIVVEINESDVTPEDLTQLERVAGRTDLPGYNKSFDHKLAGVVGRIIASGTIDSTVVHEALCDAWPDRKA